jgi:hypothetical protein
MKPSTFFLLILLSIGLLVTTALAYCGWLFAPH